MGFFDRAKQSLCCELSDKEYLEEEIKQEIIDSWDNNPNVYLVYRNLNNDVGDTTYKVIIDEIDAHKNVMRRKRLVSYPYSPIQFESGDYIQIKYQDYANFSTYLLMAIDEQFEYNVWGTMIECTSNLVWQDNNGNEISYPCVYDKGLKETGLNVRAEIVSVSGFDHIYVQKNSDTLNIEINKRFLFDNSDEAKVAYRVRSIQDVAGDNLLDLSVDIVPLGSEDNIVDNVADEINNYTIDILDSNISQLVSFTGTLHSVVKLSGKNVTKSVAWVSDNANVSIDGSGNYTLNTLGISTIRCSMVDNSTVYDEVTINVVAILPNIIKVQILPNYTKLYRTDGEITFTVYKLLDEVAQADTFTVNLSGANEENYTYTSVDGNTFKLESLDRDNVPLLVQCVSNIDASTGVLNVQLNSWK